jgi:hypothetical protein
MCITVLACPKTTLDFMRNLGLRTDQSQQTADPMADQPVVEMLQLLETDRIKLYMPPHVVSFLHHYLRDKAGDSISSEGMERLLQISHSNLSVDYDVLLNASLSLAAGHDEFEVCETPGLFHSTNSAPESSEFEQLPPDGKENPTSRLSESHENETALCETLCFLIAKSLNADFFLVHKPNYFIRMSQHLEQQNEQDVQIVSLEELLNQFRT